MAKTIKFNLICDGNPIRTLEDLQNNFSIEDALEYYNSKLLHRWLAVRGYTEELKKIEAIKDKEDLQIVKTLIDIFDVEIDSTVVERDTYILEYKKKRVLLASQYEQQSFKAESILENHHTEYMQLVETIINNNGNMPKIKAAVKEIDEHYSDLYMLNFRDLFYVLLEHAPKSIFAMLMRQNMRTKYLPYLPQKKVVADATTESTIKKSADGVVKDLTGLLTKIATIPLNATKSEETSKTITTAYTLSEDVLAMYKAICALLVSYTNLNELLGENLKEFSGVTDGYWKDVEPRGKRYLILKMESGNFVRSAGESGGDMDATAINDNFAILDGIDYKSNNATHKLLYMEV